MPNRSTLLVRSALPLVLLLSALGGCRRKEIQVYTAPKDQPFNPAPPPTPSAQAPAAAAPPAEQETWRPALTYTVPPGWQELGPDLANIGRFSAGTAQVAITPLMSMQGNEVGLVNMWRQVRGQAPLPDEEAAKTLVNVPIAGDTGKMFEVQDTVEGEARRFIVAFVHRPEGSLFFKIQGDDATVQAQKPAFLQFLEGVKFATGRTPMPAPPAESPTAPPAPATPPTAATPPPTPAAAPPTPAAAPAESTPPPAPPNLPAGWTAVQPGPMQVAKFTVPEVEGKKAEVAISIFPSDTGGVASNVKRWRGQIGLPEGDDAAALAVAKPIEGSAPGAVLVELENEGRALTGAIIPRDGKWWFYKMMGDQPAVAAAREAFIGFAKAQP